MATRKDSNDIGRTHGALVEIKGVKARVSEAEWQTRLDLAACYRLVFHYGWHHLNLNHISAAVPGEDGYILINPYGPMFNEVTASNIVKIDLDGKVLDDTPYGINPAGYTSTARFMRRGAMSDAYCTPIPRRGWRSRR